MVKSHVDKTTLNHDEWNKRNSKSHKIHKGLSGVKSTTNTFGQILQTLLRCDT